MGARHSHGRVFDRHFRMQPYISAQEPCGRTDDPVQTMRHPPLDPFRSWTSGGAPDSVRILSEFFSTPRASCVDTDKFRPYDPTLRSKVLAFPEIMEGGSSDLNQCSMRSSALSPGVPALSTKQVHALAYPPLASSPLAHF